MAKRKKKVADFVPAFNAGDKVVTTKEINLMWIGQEGVVVSCSPNSVNVAFTTGMQAGKELRCPLHAIARKL